MKPDCSFPPFYPDAVPLWLYPDLFDETKEVAHRGWWFVGLYLLSFLLNTFIFMGPILFYASSGDGQGFKTMLGFWLVLAVPGGIGVGLLIWREFNRQLRKSRELESRPESDAR